MNVLRKKFIQNVLGPELNKKPCNPSQECFAPANIALVKYWGKRCSILNLPLVSSLSYTFSGNYGTTTQIRSSEADQVIWQGCLLKDQDTRAQAILQFLDLFRKKDEHFVIETHNTIPTAAGVASSASGFAALIKALHHLYDWDVTPTQLSLLARLGSGSACRSFWPGLVFWEQGIRDDGMDSYAYPLDRPVSFMMTVVVVEAKEKAWPSRQAMLTSLRDERFRSQWVKKQHEDLLRCMHALSHHDAFFILGKIVQDHASFFHQWLVQTDAQLCYDTEATHTLKVDIERQQKQGCPVYWTQDAGPNIKLLYDRQYKNELSQWLNKNGYSYFVV